MVPPAKRVDEKRRNGARMVEPEAAFRVLLDAEWSAPSIARDRVRAWLCAHRWAAQHLDDLVLAVSEAVSNSVEHGYRIPATATPGATARTGDNTIELRGRMLTDAEGALRVEFIVRDRGRWIPPTTLPSNRGNGIPLMRACTDLLTVDHAGAGTTAVLRSRPLRRTRRGLVP